MSKPFEDKDVIFHCEMVAERYGLTINEAKDQDMPQEYAVISSPKANGGVIVFAKYRDEWHVNPWSTRFLIRELLERLNEAALEKNKEEQK